MNNNNEYFYYSDDDFEDIDSEDEFYNPETYYLTDQQIDDFIYQIQKCGSQHTFHEIEAFLCSADEIEVYEWHQNLNEHYTKITTFKRIEKLLDEKYGKPLTIATPPIHNEITENHMSSHEDETKKLPNDKPCKQIQYYQPILPHSDINYYDLSPYVNTAEVFNRNIVQLKQEIRRKDEVKGCK
jgi:hypothetical protein